MNRLLKIISSLQNKMYKLYLINLRRASFVCHLVLHFFGNRVKLSSTYSTTAAGFSYYSFDRAIHNIVTLLSLASCLYITSLLLNIINFVQLMLKTLIINYCQWQIIASLLETFRFWPAVIYCGSHPAFNSGTKKGFIEVVKFRVITFSVTFKVTTEMKH